MKEKGCLKNLPKKIYLEESEMPKAWYNLRADMVKKPEPLLNPTTNQPVTLEELSKIFTYEGAKQELDDNTRLIPIPEEVQKAYAAFRPSPLVRATELERSIGTSAKIFYKFEFLRYTMLSKKASKG